MNFGEEEINDQFEKIFSSIKSDPGALAKFVNRKAIFHYNSKVKKFDFELLKMILESNGYYIKSTLAE